jgi:hypothetical protein
VEICIRLSQFMFYPSILILKTNKLIMGVLGHIYLEDLYLEVLDLKEIYLEDLDLQEIYLEDLYLMILKIRKNNLENK